MIGVGSPQGDDAVGLHVAERLATRALPAGVRVIARDRPGVALLDDLAAAPAVVLVDALRGGEAPGRVCIVREEALARARAASSHALGVAETLALARALGRPLPALRVVGIEIADAAPGDALSPPVARALDTACELALDALAEMLADA